MNKSRNSSPTNIVDVMAYNDSIPPMPNTKKTKKNSQNKKSKKTSGASNFTKSIFRAIPINRSMELRQPAAANHREVGVEKIGSWGGEVAATAGTLLLSIPLSVVQSALPRLANFGPLYERYRVNKLSFQLVFYGPATVTGQVALIYEPDSRVNWAGMSAANVIARSFASSNKLIVNVAPAAHALSAPVDKTLRYCMDAELASGDRFAEFGRVLVVNTVPILVSNLFYTLHVRYDVSFSVPTMMSPAPASTWEYVRETTDVVMANAINWALSYATPANFLRAFRYLIANYVGHGVDLPVIVHMQMPAPEVLLASKAGFACVRTDDEESYVFSEGVWTVETGITYDQPMMITTVDPLEIEAALSTAQDFYIEHALTNATQYNTVKSRAHKGASEITVSANQITRTNFQVMPGQIGVLVPWLKRVRTSEGLDYTYTVLAHCGTDDESWPTAYVKVKRHDVAGTIKSTSILGAGVTYDDETVLAQPPNSVYAGHSGFLMQLEPPTASDVVASAFRSLREESSPSRLTVVPVPQAVPSSEQKWVTVKPVLPGRVKP